MPDLGSFVFHDDVPHFALSESFLQANDLRSQKPPPPMGMGHDGHVMPRTALDAHALASPLTPPFLHIRPRHGLAELHAD